MPGHDDLIINGLGTAIPYGTLVLVRRPLDRV
jgi:hypothetical protein